jgi:hypothetical protein
MVRDATVVLLVMSLSACSDPASLTTLPAADSFEFSLSVLWETADGLPADMLEILIDGVAGESVEEEHDNLVSAKDHSHLVEVKRGDLLTAQRRVNHESGCEIPDHTVTSVTVSMCALESGELLAGRTEIASADDECVIEGDCAP